MSDSSKNLDDTWEAIAHSLIGEPQFTPAEVTQRADVDIEQARRLWRALGFPPVPDDSRVFALTDVSILQTVHKLLDNGATTPNTLLQLTRVSGQALARLADAQITAATGRLDLGAAASEPANAQAMAEALSTLVPSFEKFLMYVWRRHLLAALFRLVAGNAAMPDPAGRMVVGFADMVDFTAVSQRLEPAEIATMIDHFEAIVYAQIPERGGRVVKMIGDAVLFAVDDPAAAADIALALQEADRSDDTLPEIRVGLAWGPTVSFSGDLFGPTVNLASRLVGTARPGTVLISDELGAHLETLANPQLEVRRKRRVSLKGIGRVRVWVLRRGKAAGH